MTNDTTTLNGALNELGETLAENLTMKGINANAEDGLTTLANKIKDIRFDLSAAALTLTASTEEVLLNDSIELSARLVNQNNESISGALILFKTDLLADPVIGHAVTNDDGVATFEYVVDAYGVYDFYAEFLGIEQCTSQQATVTCDYNLVLSADKDILSYNGLDSCTITGVLDSETGLVENEEIDYTIMHNETELDAGTLTTDENGEIELVYDAIGAGEVEVILSLRSLLQKTFVLEDCNYWNTAEVIRTSTNGSTIYDNNMSEALPTDCEISFDIWSNNNNPDGEHRFFLLPKSQYSSGTVQPRYALYVDQVGGNRGNLGQRNNNTTNSFIELNPFDNSSYHTVKIIKTNTILEFYIDNELKTTQTLDWINNYTDYCFSMMRWTSIGTSKIKNIKIKTL